MIPRIAILLMALLLAAGRGVAPAQWTSVGTLAVPEYNYLFLSATPQGNLLAATFNSMPSNTPPRELPVLLITDLESPRPNVREVMRLPFEASRGYAGLACDATGAFYVSADTGAANTCFLVKFNPDGSPATSFGANGVIRPGLRTLGLDVFGNYLLMAVSWGVIQVYDKDTGRLIGSTPPAPQRNGEPFYVRDIAIDPKSLRIFGVARGGVVTWGGGAPWSPAAYTFNEIAQPSGDLRSGEGLSLDPLRRSVLITPIPGNTLVEIEGYNRLRRHPITTAAPTTHVADSVVSFSGEYLYLSDMVARRIHVMRRDMTSLKAEQEELARQRQAVAARAAAERGTTAPTATPARGVAAVKWHPDYDQIVQRARSEGRPMIVYFRSPRVARCQEFEKGVLLTEAFNREAADFYCVFEDATRNTMQAYRFGVIRVPHIVVLDKQGEPRAEFTSDIDQAKLFEAMASVR